MAPIETLSSLQILIGEAVGDMLVNVQKEVSKPVLGTLTARRKIASDRLSAGLQAMLVHNVHNVLNSTVFISQFTDAPIDEPGLTTTVIALFKWQQQKACDLEGQDLGQMSAFH